MDQNIKHIEEKLEVLKEQLRLIENKSISLTKEEEKEIKKYLKYTIIALEATRNNYGKNS